MYEKKKTGAETRWKNIGFIVYCKYFLKISLSTYLLEFFYVDQSPLLIFVCILIIPRLSIH